MFLCFAYYLVTVWELLADNKVKLSLRSHPNVDCSIIAKSLNGGGHCCASLQLYLH